MVYLERNSVFKFCKSHLFFWTLKAFRSVLWFINFDFGVLDDKKWNIEDSGVLDGRILIIESFGVLDG